MQDLAMKWQEGELSKVDVENWVENQSEVDTLKKVVIAETPEDEDWMEEYGDKLDHIVDCLYAIYKHDKEGRTVGGFLREVLGNNFVYATTNADSTNKIVLPIYGKFLYNLAPMSVWKGD